MRILVTGGTGLLGRKVLRVLEKEHDVVSIARNSENFGEIADILDQKKIDLIFNSVRPETVIHLAAISDPEICEDNKEMAHKINVLGTEIITKSCKKWSAKLIFSSTDYIFNGVDPPYDEYCQANPINVYGETKALAERIVLKNLGTSATIFRFSILYGFNSVNDRKTFVTEILSKLDKGESILADDNQIRYPVLIDDVADSVRLALKDGLSGIYHLSSFRGITKYEWAKIIANTFNYESNIRISNRTDIRAKRPANAKLVNTKNDKIFSIKEIENGLKAMKSQMVDVS